MVDVATEPDAPLVHGLKGDLVAPDWPPLSIDEVRSVLGSWGPTSNWSGSESLIGWRSPRPMSAAAIVAHGESAVFVKRHDLRVRTAAQLRVEHQFARHLGSRGIGVARVLEASQGTTTVTRGHSVYEMHELLSGLDLYRDQMSWTPFQSLGHARAAGVALAELHAAARSFRLPARPPAVLTSSVEVIIASDPVETVGQLAAARPGLARGLMGRQWEHDVARYLVPTISRLAPRLRAVQPLWGHGDWHPSNLTWSTHGAEAVVSAVFDFGLANRTSAIYDLALAIERSAVNWLALSERECPEADLDVVDALVGGYRTLGQLELDTLALLPLLLPVVHVDQALSEVEYFADVVGAQAEADLAYHVYLVGHARWFEESAGAALIEHLHRLSGAHAGARRPRARTARLAVGLADETARSPHTITPQPDDDLAAAEDDRRMPPAVCGLRLSVRSRHEALSDRP
jgi:Ser/Thr protein kinase RdoA (MazF antagonist)